MTVSIQQIYPAFAGEVYRALNDTLVQDRLYTFDATLGLYRGETSFLDWRQQTYPMWAAKDVTFIGQSFALSTNVLHYEALRLAAEMSAVRNPSQAIVYQAQAKSLKDAINRRFWRSDRGMYMSYIGGADHPQPFDTYDLLGISLAITSGVASGRPREARMSRTQAARRRPPSAQSIAARHRATIIGSAVKMSRKCQ